MHVLRQQLFGALIGLSRASESKEILDSSGMALIHGLSLAYDPVWENSDSEISEHMETSVKQVIETLHAEKALMAPDCQSPFRRHLILTNDLLQHFDLVGHRRLGHMEQVGRRTERFEGSLGS